MTHMHHRSKTLVPFVRRLRPLFAGVLVAVGLLAPAAFPAADPVAAPPTPRLRIVSDPPKATVSVDRKTRGETPLLVSDLAPGPHLVCIQKQGFRDVWQTVEVVGQDTREIDVTLETITGLVLVRSTPTNADITVKGIAIGRTPTLVTSLPVGTHRLKIATPGYQFKEVEVPVQDRTPATVQVDLISDSSTLTIETDAEGATVRVNGIDHGPSPCTVERIPEGEVNVDIRAEGYTPLHHKLKLAAGETQKIKLSLEPVPASLRVVSIPEKARVYVKDEFRGVTPLNLPNLQPGSFRVRVEMPGFETDARTIELPRGAARTEEFRLVSNLGGVELITDPERVTVFLDDRKVGETKAKPNAAPGGVSEPLALENIRPGPHELRLTRKGYAEAKQQVQIESGKTLPVQVKLVRRFIPDCQVTTESGVYKGVLDSVTDEFIRLETAPGVMTSIPVKDVKYRRTLREDGTAE